MCSPHKKMGGIETSIMPLVSIIGFGGIVGFLLGFAIKRIDSPRVIVEDS